MDRAKRGCVCMGDEGGGRGGGGGGGGGGGQKVDLARHTYPHPLYAWEGVLGFRACVGDRISAHGISLV